MSHKNSKKIPLFCILTLIFVHFLASRSFGGEQKRESNSSPVQFTVLDDPVIGVAVRCDYSPSADSTSPVPSPWGGAREGRFHQFLAHRV